VSFGELIEIAFDQNGAESAEAHDLCSCVDRAGSRRSNAGDVLVHMASFQTVGRNEGVDVEAAGDGAGGSGDLYVADWSGRNPGKDVLDLVVGQRRVRGTAQESEHVGGRSPTFLVADQSEIDVAGRLWLGYTGN
jgi:hypothetical protein